MFPVSLTITNAADLTKVMVALGLTQLTEAPGKPSVATTAPSSRTAEAGPSTSDPSPAAPAKATPKPAATKPTAAPAAAPSAPADKPVDYATLSAAVLKLMKLSPTAPAEIAAGLGFQTFKAMKEAENAVELFAQALPLVEAKIAELSQV